MAEKYPGEEVSEQLDSSIESSASSCSSSSSSRASSPDMLRSSLQEHLDSSNDPKGRTKTTKPIQSDKTTNDPKGRTKATKTAINPEGRAKADKTVITPKGRDKTVDDSERQTKTTKATKITVDPEGRTAAPEGRKTRVQDLKLKAKMLGIKGYSKLNKKQLEIVLSIHPDPEPTVQSSAVSTSQAPTAQHPIESKAHDSKAQLPVERNAHIALEKLSKMNLTELKALSKEAGIKLSHYSKEKAKSIAKTRKMLIND